MNRLLIGQALLAGLLWGSFLAWIGIHTTGDSVAYFRAALDLAENGSMNMNPIWPPLYPVLLGGMTALTGLPTEAAVVLSGTLLAVLLFATGWVVTQATRDNVLATVVLLFCCCWWEMLYIFKVAWSEQLFAALVALHLVAIIRHCQTGALRDFAMAAATASLVVLSRYIGYSIMGIFLVYSVIWVVRNGEWRRHLMVFSASVSPLVGWLLFNLYRTSTLHGERTPTDLTTLDNLQMTISVFRDQLWSTPMLTALLFSASVAAVVVIWRGQGWIRTVLMYVWAYLLGYTALLIYAASTVQMDVINPRFLSPLLPTVLIVIALPVGGLAELIPKSRFMIQRVVFSLLLVGLLGGMRSWQAGMLSLVSGVNTVAFHGAAGFSASQTAVELNAMFAKKLAENPQLAVGLLTSEKNGSKASVMVMRRAVLEGNGLTKANFTEVSKRSISISLMLDGQEREMLAWSPRLMNNVEDVRRALQEASQSTGESELLVITRRKVLRRTGVPDADLSSLSHYRCQPEPVIEPYLIYTCSTASASR